MTAKALIPALASVGLHVAAGVWVLGGFGDGRQDAPAESIFISEIKPLVAVTEKRSENRGLTPDRKLADLPKEFPRGVRPQPKLQTSLQAQVEREIAEFSRSARAEDLMADPARRGPFIDYFAVVKEQINKTLKSRYSQESGWGNQVSLNFSLDSSGRLDWIRVAHEDPAWGPRFREVAQACVRESSPFPPFPKELPFDRIAFNLAVTFD